MHKMQHRQRMLGNQLLWTVQVLALASLQVVTARYYHIPNVQTHVKWLPVNHTLDMTAHTLLTCAILCRRHACTSFTFLDKVCSMDGVGDGEQGAALEESRYLALTNAALGQPTYGSSHYGGSGPGNAVDDNSTCNVWSSDVKSCCFATYHNPGNWMLVDLGSPKRLIAVDIMSKEQISRPLEVRVGQDLVTDGDLTDYELFGTTEGGIPWPGRTTISSPKSIVGQMVSIQQMVTNNFYVCDLQVLVSN